MSKRNFLNVVVIIAVTIGLAGCGIFKKGAKKSKKKKSETVATSPRDTTVANETKVNPNMDKKLVELYSPVWKNEIVFKTFSGKAKCHYEGAGQNHDFTANIRVKRDEAAWVMVSALGGIVQVARVYATPDSFAMISYLEKTYTSMKIDQVNKVLPFPVDFTMLQNLFIGNALRTDGEVTDAVDMSNIVTLKVKKENLNQDISIDKAASSIASSQLYLDNEQSEANIALKNYQDRDGRKFPTERIVNVVDKGTPHLLEMNFSDAKFDVAVEMPFSIPKNYTQK